MKKMILVAIVFLMAQTSMAAGLAKETLQSRIKPYAERIEAARELNAKDFSKDPKVRALIEKSLKKIVESANAGDAANLFRLINNDKGSDVLMEVARLSSIIGDKAATTTTAEISTAREALELLSLSGKNLLTIANSTKQAAEYQSQIDLAVKASGRIAAFKTFESQTANAYYTAYKVALETMTPRQAMEEASRVSKKKITEEDMSCTL